MIGDYADTGSDIQALMFSIGSYFFHIRIIFHAGNRSRRKVFVSVGRSRKYAFGVADCPRNRFDEREGSHLMAFFGLIRGLILWKSSSQSILSQY